jgi:DNA mismatch endonuclease (patch repair protein)
MVDTVTPETRSRMMARIRRESTRPELWVRRYLHAAGLRFLVNDRRLPGQPDLVFPSARAVLFVHGCFWHRHTGCRFATMPGTRYEFWASKFAANVARDERVESLLKTEGWNVLKIWECEVGTETVLDELFWKIRSLG